jgi:hypothetical protein
MEKGISDKIPAVLRKQARKLESYNLMGMGKNCLLSQCMLLALVISAAFLGISLEQKALNDRNFTSDALYHHLNSKVGIASAEAMLNYFVSKRDLKLLRRRFGNWGFYVAIDFTDEMFYGEKGTAGVVGTKHKKGSNHAFRYMTMCIVTPKGRFLIWAYPMEDRQETLFLLNKALEKLEETGLKVHAILLDREFNYTDALALVGEKYKYITPADQDKKFKRYIKGKECPAYCDDWRIRNKMGEQISTQLAVLQEQGHKYGYYTNMQRERFFKNMEVLSNIYGMRWGIETAHREVYGFRISTTCKKMEVRYLYFVISVLLYNLTVWINLFFGLAGAAHVTFSEMKELLRQIFEEFNLWLKSPERWLSMLSFGNARMVLFACFWLPVAQIGSAAALP